ncbi:hypothetical protein JNO48_05355 [Clostridiales bacterium]|nr:hypothetical protein JNO48_05355 [Clostridiales bacterium]
MTVTSGELLEGDELVATATGSATNVADTAEGNNPIAAGYKIMHGDTDVTENYVITAEAGTLTINPVEIELTADSATKEYDGTALTKNTYKITKGAFVGEEGLASVTVEGSQTVVGKSANTITGHTLKENTEAENYTIAYKQGELEVTKASVEITITAGDGEQTYNGNALTNTEVTVTSGELLEGDELVATATGSATNVADTAEGNNPIAAGYKIMHGDTDVTENYVITAEAGTLTINPRSVSFTGETDKRTYTGSEIELTKVTVGGDGLVSGHKDNVTYSAKGTEVGTYDGTITAKANVKILAGENDVTKNYDITVTPGKLTIEKTSEKFTISLEDDEYTYDGTAHASTKTPSSTAKTGTTTYSYSFTEDGEYVSDLSSLKKVSAGEYTIYVKATNPNYTDGAKTTAKLTINARKVTFTGETDTKTYTGSEIELTTVTVSGDGLVSGHTDNVKYSAKGTEVGTYNGTITEKTNVKILAGENDVTKNYDITVTPGKLTIEKTSEKFTISLEDDEYTYDGTAHASTKTPSSTAKTGTTTYSYSFTEDGEYVSDLSSLTKVDAGEYTIYVKATNPNYSSEATLTSTLKINKRTVNLISEGGQKVYDGTPLTNNKVTVTGEGFVGEEGATYNVTGTQTLVGSSENKFTYTLNEGTKAANYEIKTVFGDLTVTDGEGEGEKPVDPSLVVTKTAEEGPYGLGDEVTFTITATNIYEAAKTIALSEIEGVTLAKNSFENVAGGETVNTTATYTITEEDILKGEFTNTVTAALDNLTKTADATVKTEKPDPSLNVVKETTSTPANGETYALGETISYKITVTNDGNLAITNVKVDDELTGLHETIESLAVGANKVYTTSYTVTEDDILAGSVKNEATADGENKSEEPTEPGKGTKEDPTEKPDPSLNVVKETTSTPANGETYALGETISYKITVTNDGNLAITNVKVDDELTGLHETIESLAVGEEKVFTTTYTVTEDDILAGGVKNVATADGDNKTEDPTDPGTGTKDDPTDDPKGHMTVTKISTSEPASADGYMLGETIEYRIVVTNDGNLTMTNVKVEDELTGLNETIESLAPGEEKEFTTSYVVTEKDVEAGNVVNVATAKGADPTDEEVPSEPGTDTVPVIQRYRLTVNYWIGQVNGEKAADTFTAQYMAGSVYNVASPILTGHKADKERVSGTIMSDTTLDVVYTANEYTLTILYVYEDGTQAAPTYQRTLTYGEAYSVLSPVIDGYTANFRVVNGEMPARNMAYTIRYQAAGNGIIIDDYDTPLGLSGFGVCIGETYE